MGGGRQRAARARDGAGRRGPGVGGVRRRQAEGDARGRHARLRPPARRPTRRRPRSRRCCGELNDDPRVSGILLQLPTPEAHRRQRPDVADRPGEGRRRPDARLRRPARQGPARAAAVHAGRLHGAARPLRRRARGRRGGRRRPLRPRRQAGRADAARAPRDRDDLPLAHARPARGLPPRGRARRGGRPPPHGPGRLGQGGRDGDRRRHQPHRRRASSATSTSTPRPSAPRGSRRCRAASAR